MNCPDKMAEDGRLRIRLMQKMFNQLRAFAQSLELTQGVGYRKKRSPRGTTLEVLAENTVTEEGSGVIFRGEWRSDVDDYVEGNLVVIRGGISAGAYIALQDVPQGTAPAYPDVGVYWVSISRDFAGAWA